MLLFILPLWKKAVLSKEKKSISFGWIKSFNSSALPTHMSASRAASLSSSRLWSVKLHIDCNVAAKINHQQLLRVNFASKFGSRELQLKNSNRKENGQRGSEGGGKITSNYRFSSCFQRCFVLPPNKLGLLHLLVLRVTLRPAWGFLFAHGSWSSAFQQLHFCSFRVHLYLRCLRRCSWPTWINAFSRYL